MRRLLSRARRRLTPAGRLAAGALAACALYGFDTDQNAAYQAFALLAVLLAQAALWAPFFRPRLEARRLLPRFGTAGTPLPYALEVRNRGARALSGLTLFDGEASAALPPLAPGGAAEAAFSVVPERRGRLRLGAAAAGRPDPLGLVNGLCALPGEDSVLVLPPRYPVGRVDLPGVRRHQSGGVALASAVGDSLEFRSLRDYRPGDPLRKVHWRSWAKTGSPVVREEEAEYFVRHALVLDTFSASATPAFEEAVSVAASFACELLTQESLLDLLFVGAEPYCVTAGRGLGGPETLLEVLAGVAPCAGRPFSDLAPAVERRAPALSGLICVLLGLDEGRRAFLSRLRGLGLPVLALAVVEPGAPEFSQPGVRRIEVGRAAEGLAGL